MQSSDMSGKNSFHMAEMSSIFKYSLIILSVLVGAPVA